VGERGDGDDDDPFGGVAVLRVGRARERMSENGRSQVRCGGVESRASASASASCRQRANR
jgi:hypothetical protein